ncbi:MAG: ComF family protein [Parcubacteria group bacterium]|nr:ComF family protein [Parcubacteria group bacterium]
MTFKYQMLAGFLDRALGFLFPEDCLGCGAGGSFLCASCAAELPPAPRSRAGRRGSPAIRSLYDYRHPTVRAAIWALKYKGARSVARVFARALYDVLLEDIADRALCAERGTERPLIVPVPLSWWRKSTRGFNQTELLARELERLDEGGAFIVRADILKKIRNTPSQTSISGRTERLKNLKDAFAVREPELVKRRFVILLDDVTTTGATLAEAARTLRAAGAKRVVAYTIAH